MLTVRSLRPTENRGLPGAVLRDHGRPAVSPPPPRPLRVERPIRRLSRDCPLAQRGRRNLRGLAVVREGPYGVRDGHLQGFAGGSGGSSGGGETGVSFQTPACFHASAMALAWLHFRSPCIL